MPRMGWTPGPAEARPGPHTWSVFTFSLFDTVAPSADLRPFRHHVALPPPFRAQVLAVELPSTPRF